MTPSRAPSIHDYPWLLTGLGIDVNDLGTVMLPVRFRSNMLELGYQQGLIDPSDLYESPNAERFWIAGDVTDNAHVTLLYGLLDKISDPTRDHIARARIEALLLDWPRPRRLPVLGFEAWPSTFPDEDYTCIVARVDDHDGQLAEARARLQYLPHILTFPEWKLHATVAYVRPDAAERWLGWLRRTPRTLEVPSGPLNFGEDKPTKTTSGSPAPTVKDPE